MPIYCILPMLKKYLVVIIIIIVVFVYILKECNLAQSTNSATFDCGANLLFLFDQLATVLFLYRLNRLL